MKKKNQKNRFTTIYDAQCINIMLGPRPLLW